MDNVFAEYESRHQLILRGLITAQHLLLVQFSSDEDDETKAEYLELEGVPHDPAELKELAAHLYNVETAAFADLYVELRYECELPPIVTVDWVHGFNGNSYSANSYHQLAAEVSSLLLRQIVGGQWDWEDTEGPDHISELIANLKAEWHFAFDEGGGNKKPERKKPGPKKCKKKDEQDQLVSERWEEFVAKCEKRARQKDAAEEWLRVYSDMDFLTEGLENAADYKEIVHRMELARKRHKRR